MEGSGEEERIENKEDVKIQLQETYIKVSLVEKTGRTGISFSRLQILNFFCDLLSSNFFFHFQEEKSIPDEQDNCRKLFIGGLNYFTTEESLKAFYEQWGKIIDVCVMKEPKTKRQVQIGLVNFS
ncbi:hypothetical protein ANN_11380 [Periplaneta americana]|uniref:RRM domain-containing protein n=1 Tax=Periplaneta americana TaxID=6978 RepID=A0ABQ8T4U7_PERAM|nr:hypothetical protein ANN_11380 [Periplaneta americana]